jgi:hypothetical protein
LPHVHDSDDKIAALAAQTGVDLSALPPVMSTAQLAGLLGVTPAALAQDRYCRRADAIPYTKIGARVRYLRADVCRYLIDHRMGSAPASS